MMEDHAFQSSSSSSASPEKQLTPTTDGVTKSLPRNKLLLEIQRKRRVSFNIGDEGKDDDEDDFVMVHELTTWTDLFVRTFVLCDESSEIGENREDDLLFFVKPGSSCLTRSLTGYLPKPPVTQLSVFRKHSKQLPIGNVDIDWEDTLYLNTIMHSFEYALTLAVVSRTGQDEVQILYKSSQQVYPSPSYRNMHQEKSSQGEKITYPLIYFSIDGYKESMTNTVLRDCESLSLELIATDKSDRGSRYVLFSGSIKYHQIFTAIHPFLLASSSSSCRFSLRSKREERDMNFIKIKGTIGSAEIAIRTMFKELSAPVSPCDYSDNYAQIDESSWQQFQETPYTERRMSSVDEKTLSSKIRGWKERRIQKAKSESEGINMAEFATEVPEIQVPTIEQDMQGESKCDLWRCPGFMQAYFLNKRTRQFHCLPLFTAVTYICVPCEQIIDSLLESNQQPVLSF